LFCKTKRIIFYGIKNKIKVTESRAVTLLASLSRFEKSDKLSEGGGEMEEREGKREKARGGSSGDQQ